MSKMSDTHLDSFEYDRSKNEPTESLVDFLRNHSRADSYAGRDDWAARLWIVSERLKRMQDRIKILSDKDYHLPTKTKSE